MLGPEERHRDIALAMAHHVEGGDLALAAWVNRLFVCLQETKPSGCPL